MNIQRGSKKVVLELLTLCNLKCKHCFYRNLGTNSQGFLLKEKAFILIDKFKANRIDKLVFTGGEPTTHPNFIEIAEYAIKNIPKVSLCTNGVIIDKRFRDKVLNLNFSGYTVSIDSHINKIHDTFRGMNGALKKTLDFCKQIKKNGKNLSIHITIHPDNIDHIEETINYCNQFDCEIVVGTIYFYDKIKNNEYKAKIEDFKKRHLRDKDIILVGFNEYCKNKNCPDRKNVFMVNKDGQIISCYWKKDGGKIIIDDSLIWKYQTNIAITTKEKR